MLKTNSLLLCFVLLHCSLSAQMIVVDDSSNVEELLQNNLFNGCVDIANVNSYTNGNVNNMKTFGFFNKAASNFPFDSGIILSTGFATAAGNSVISTPLNQGSTSWGTDADLESILGISNTTNATSIEFEITSVVDQLNFEFIFASEEYALPDYICTNTDSFAILIKEVNNSTYTNIATVGDNNFVSPATIHSEIFGFCSAVNGDLFENYSVGDTNFNGRSIVLSASAAVLPFTTYQVKLVIADGGDKNYDSAVFLKTIQAEPSLELGQDINTCATTTILDASVNLPNVRYDWYRDGVLYITDGDPVQTVAVSAEYYVEASVEVNGNVCSFGDSITVNLFPEQSIPAIAAFELCDDNMDNVEWFDLSEKDEEILASAPSGVYDIQYFSNLEDAQNNLMPITSPIQNNSNPQVVFVRLEELTSGCLSFEPISLVVNSVPEITGLTPFVVCDADGNYNLNTNLNLASFDLTITGGNNNLNVHYYLTQQEAENDENRLPNDYASGSTTVFARVTNDSGCYQTTSIDIQVFNSPDLNNETVFLDACDTDHDGFASFNLNLVLEDFSTDFNNLTTTFHTSVADADSGANPIQNPSEFTNTVAEEQILFLRVENDISACYSIRSFEIHTNLLLSETLLDPIKFCDLDNDGIQNIDLNAVRTMIANNLENLDIDFYPSEEDQETGNIIMDSSYTMSGNSLQLFIDISSESCTEQASIDFILYNNVQFNNLPNQTVCDNNSDGITTINVSNFDTDVIGGLINYEVKYFTSLSDAENNNNPIGNSFTNSSNPQMLYVRVGNNVTDCYDISSFNVEVNLAPDINKPEPLILCDSDLNEIEIVNLFSIIPELGLNPGVEIGFFNSLENANNNLNSIPNPENYSASSETIFIRATDNNSTTNCYTTTTLDIFINTIPVVTEINDFQICTQNTENANFMLESKDAEILNGQSNKEVFYFVDAQQTQPINKNLPYTNISNPQTIYVEVRNINDEECKENASFEIYVGMNPFYNLPEDLDFVECDAEPVDGIIEVDFNSVIQEIISGIENPPNVTFHDNIQDANLGNNALPLLYQNSENPQRIFIRIENNQNCYNIEELGINILNTPKITDNASIQICDTNYDGLNTFNITENQIEIFDVRQDNLISNYYESEADLFQQINPITNLTDYQTSTNPQTIYLGIFNSVTGCYTSSPIQLISLLPPQFNAIDRYELCDNSNNSVNLSVIDSSLIDDLSQFSVRYYTSLENANNTTNELFTYSWQTPSDQLFARIENNTTSCYIIHDFRLVIHPLPSINPAVNMEDCAVDYSGLLTFDLNEQITNILAEIAGTDYVVTFHENMTDATGNTNATNLQYTVQDYANLVARVENTITNCVIYSSFALRVHPKPFIEIPTQVLCGENDTVFVSALDTATTNTYLWSTSETTSGIYLDNVGNYSVTITTINNCSSTVNFEVIRSSPAEISFTEVVNFSDPNSIEINVNGMGDYLYGLDDGPLQSSGFFNNVTLGYHQISVVDINGCTEVNRTVLVIDAPKFFTPNGDGYFDRWHIIGLETLPGSKIYIFDRYGKLIKNLKAEGPGWDGTYNGIPLAATDYWFLAKIIDGERSFDYRGHFSLKR